MLAVAAAAATWTNIGAGPSSMGVVHGLARNTIATVISKTGSKATTGEFPASQAIPWVVFSVAADNSVSPNNPAIVKLDDGRTIQVTKVAVWRVPKQ